jgi:hypothetical protein
MIPLGLLISAIFAGSRQQNLMPGRQIGLRDSVNRSLDLATAGHSLLRVADQMSAGHIKGGPLIGDLSGGSCSETGAFHAPSGAWPEVPRCRLKLSVAPALSYSHLKSQPLPTKSTKDGRQGWPPDSIRESVRGVSWEG